MSVACRVLGLCCGCALRIRGSERRSVVCGARARSRGGGCGRQGERVCVVWGALSLAGARCGGVGLLGVGECAGAVCVCVAEAVCWVSAVEGARAAGALSPAVRSRAMQYFPHELFNRTLRDHTYALSNGLYTGSPSALTIYLHSLTRAVQTPPLQRRIHRCLKHSPETLGPSPLSTPHTPTGSKCYTCVGRPHAHCQHAMRLMCPGDCISIIVSRMLLLNGVSLNSGEVRLVTQ